MDRRVPTHRYSFAAKPAAVALVTRMVFVNVQLASSRLHCATFHLARRLVSLVPVPLPTLVPACLATPAPFATLPPLNALVCLALMVVLVWILSMRLNVCAPAASPMPLAERTSTSVPRHPAFIQEIALISLMTFLVSAQVDIRARFASKTSTSVIRRRAKIRVSVPTMR